MRDAYEQFFEKGYITKQQFFEFGLSETIYAPLDEAEQEWKILKDRIQNNETVHIRGFGRDASGTQLFFDLYNGLFSHTNVIKDSNNNAEPTKLIAELTGYSKSGKAGFDPIRNYQVSHIFGRTKNIYTFTAPWNIAYIPKILDPFTGHEARGDTPKEYRTLFQKQAYERFRYLIEDFNTLMNAQSLIKGKQDFIDMLSKQNGITPRQLTIFKKAIEAELSPIVFPTF